MEPCDLTLTDAARELRSKSLSPVELTSSVLQRVASVEEKLNAFTAVLADQAREQAKFAENEMAHGSFRGPLHGIPVAAKDLFNIAGLPTTASSKVRANYIAKNDSTCVKVLADAGAVMIGKTQLHEFAYGVMTPNSRNPWDTERTAGGSSGGSAAAVAAGECLMALGTDTGGSIRIPSSACGVVGLKPTYGRVSRDGVTSLSWSLDHAGALTRTVSDAALALSVLAGPDSKDPASTRQKPADFTTSLNRGVEGLTLGVPTNYFFDDIDPEVEAATRAAIQLLESNGAVLREIKIPCTAYFMATLFGIIVPEASAYHQEMLRESGDLYTSEVRVLLEAGELVSASQYIKAQRARTVIQHAMRDAFEGLDAIVAPTLPMTAVRLDEELFTLPSGAQTTAMNAYVGHSAAGSLTGLPTLSVPCGFSAAGMPIGMQIMGRPYDEATVLRIGQNYETSTPWTQRRPTLGTSAQ